MIELIPTVWVSSNAKIDENVLFGKNAVVYGDTTVYGGTIIEDNVTIGHPSPSEVANLVSRHADGDAGGRDLALAYDSVTEKRTHIGKGCIIRSNTVIYDGNYIDDFFDCGHNVIIREDCKVSKFCYFFTHTQIKRAAVIGQGCRVAGTVCDRTSIGAYSSMLGHTVHKNYSGVGGQIENAPTIGEGVVVGRGAVLVGGISVGDFSVIGANSVVLRTVEPFAVVAGVPGKVKGSRCLGDVSDIMERMREDRYECKASAVARF